MAKIRNMWLQGAIGRVGGSTLYTANGETIIRDGSSDVKNPQTDAQMIQRVFAKTAMAQYSAMQEIVNHSFQGKSAGSKCMNHFLSLNMNYYRSRAAELQSQGVSLDEFFQFMAKGQTKYTPTAAIISEGSLPAINAGIGTQGQFAYFVVGTFEETLTYKMIANQYGLKRGDQITFVTVEKLIGQQNYIFKYARAILDPRNSDGTSAPMSVAFVSNGEIQYPNIRNKGKFNTLEYGGGQLKYKLTPGNVVATGVIVSRKERGAWKRSSCQLVLNENLLETDRQSLAQAVANSYSNGEIYTDSEQYLNNAGTGGQQGNSIAAEGSDEPQYSNIVTINGVQQDVGGGDVNIGSELRSIVVTGANIPSGVLTLDDTVGGGGQSRAFDGSGTSASWTGLIVASSIDTKIVKRNGVTWFIINMVSGNME
ncbi:MAG: hypothetical protein IIV77_00050 [Bacteroidaceae bacterium]|nr:hypothetical protein [Bacteroidaceae bacterium]